MEKTAECRNCGKKLIGKPYQFGGGARHPETGEPCNVNYYGGYVCSDLCDREATRKQDASIDAHMDPRGYYQ